MSKSSDTAREIINFQMGPKTLLKHLRQRLSRLNSKGERKPFKSVMIWGPPGIGKTDIARQLADERNSRLVALHLPQFDPTDIKGIPVRMDDGTVHWVPSSYLPQQHTARKFTGGTISLAWEFAVGVAVTVKEAVTGKDLAWFNHPDLPDNSGGFAAPVIVQTADGFDVTFNPGREVRLVLDDKAIIFLDELSAAEPSTQNAALQLVLDRQINEYCVPDSVPVLAAGNREEDGAFVQPMSHPLANRFDHVTMKHSNDDWIEWALATRKRPEVIGFIKYKADALFNYVPETLSGGNMGWASPRSWASLADQYEDLAYYESLFDPSEKFQAKQMRLASFSGLVGYAQASAFIGYLEIMHDLPSPEDVIKGTADPLGKVERSKTFGLLYALIYALEDQFHRNYDRNLGVDQQSANWTGPREAILNYLMDNFDSESIAWAVTVIFQSGMKDDFNALRGSAAFLKLTKDHGNIINRLSRAKR